jgi:hypothetical protein
MKILLVSFQKRIDTITNLLKKPANKLKNFHRLKSLQGQQEIWFPSNLTPVITKIDFQISKTHLLWVKAGVSSNLTKMKY